MLQKSIKNKKKTAISYSQEGVFINKQNVQWYIYLSKSNRDFWLQAALAITGLGINGTVELKWNKQAINLCKQGDRPVSTCCIFLEAWLENLKGMEDTSPTHKTSLVFAYIKHLACTNNAKLHSHFMLCLLLKGQ